LTVFTRDEARIPDLAAPPLQRTRLLEIFRALADPTRFEMLRMMREQGELACTACLGKFGVSKSTISYHVRTLRTAGLIKIRKEGSYYHYSLDEARVTAVFPELFDILAQPIEPFSSGWPGQPVAVSPNTEEGRGMRSP
jgi:ArsR family transcriptional regulator